MAAQPFVLTVPLEKGHWITLVSNKEMSVDSFRMLNRYLSLQREMLAEDAPNTCQVLTQG